MKIRIAFMLLFIVNTLFGQRVIGKILDERNESVIGATIIQLNSGNGVVTDLDGTFSIDVSSSPYIVIHALGYYSDTLEVSSIDANEIYTHTLTLESQLIDGVVIAAKSLTTEKRDKGYAVEVIESKSYKNLNSDVNSILKTVSGVNVRETGGLGSGFNLSLNGLSGNQIRYFVDGVLMENFGSSLQLNNFPSNLVKNIEVYKGVVPIALGTDALGGAINITTNDNYDSYLDASYSLGSFNTHRVSINGKYVQPDRKYYVTSSIFFNHSDNDYDIDSVKVYDLELGNLLGYETVQRFHDHYTSGMANVKVGTEKLGWLDNTYINLIGSRNRKNYQHPDNNIKKIFGQFHTTNNSMISTISTSKKTDDFMIDAHFTYGNIKSIVVDTSRLKYNWLGEFVIRNISDPKGELSQRRSLFKLDDRILRLSINGKINFSDYYKLALGYSDNYLRRMGNDEVDELNVSFRSPNTIDKRIVALSNDLKYWDRRIKTSIFFKYYNYSGEIIYTSEGKQNTEKIALDKLGYGMANSIDFYKKIKLKLSFEKAYRIPEPYEILGDGIYVSVNPNLIPENSDNVNVGVFFRNDFGKIRLTTDVNYFYRNSNDFIRFKPLGPFGKYENLQSVRSRGLEGNILLEYNKRIQLSTNLTYQEITDENEFDEGIENTNYGSRVPNVPYLFGNARLGLIPLDNDLSKLGVYLSCRYVHDFFLNWETLGSKESKNIIPQQFTQNVEFEYSLVDRDIHFSVGAYNVSDAVIYDNFNIQKPGRSFNFKIRYFISKL